ncbi:MAG: complex I NDUFA9 subunit family protein [Alphaproteobacteria bacterium]
MTAPLKLERSQVTVFGGSGFLGRHLVQRLAATGAVVRVAVRDPLDAGFLKPLGDVGQIVPMAADIAVDTDVAAAVAGADAVVNLVGILSETRRRTFQEIHHRAAGRVAAAAAAAGAKRLVHVSALGANKASESAYARTKALGEEAVLAAFPDATILRPSVIFGPEDHFFNTFAAIARLSPVVPVFGASPTLTFAPGQLPKVKLFGKGGPKFQLVYVGDVAEAIMRALESADAAGKRYELGGPRAYSFKEVLDLVLKEIGRPRILVPVPLALLAIKAAALELFGIKLITRDQVRLLKRDNVVGRKALTFADLGIQPKTVEIILPTYLDRFRRRTRSV